MRGEKQPFLGWQTLAQSLLINVVSSLWPFDIPCDSNISPVWGKSYSRIWNTFNKKNKVVDIPCSVTVPWKLPAVHNLWMTRCIDYSFHCCGQMSDKSNLGQKGLLGHAIWGTRHVGKSWPLSHRLSNQETGMSAVVGSLSPFYSVQKPNSRVMLPTVGGSPYLNEPYLEAPSQACPEACLLGDPTSCQADTINHYKGIPIRGDGRSYPCISGLSSV